MLILATTPPKQNIIALLHIPAFLASEYGTNSVPHSAIQLRGKQHQVSCGDNYNRFKLQTSCYHYLFQNILGSVSLHVPLQLHSTGMEKSRTSKY